MEEPKRERKMVEMDPETWDRIADVATRERRSVRQQVAIAVEAWLASESTRQVAP